jgi:hypothetical protein
MRHPQFPNNPNSMAQPLNFGWKKTADQGAAELSPGEFIRLSATAECPV